jgi:peptide/nickel transport system permease protein
MPTDPARTILGMNASQDQIIKLRSDLGLDQPVYKQLVKYVWQTVTLDFGRSYIDQRSVFKEVWERFFVSIVLVGLAVVFIFLYLIIVTLSSQSLILRKIVAITDFLFSSLPIFFSAVVVSLFTLYWYPYVQFSGKLQSVQDVLAMLPAAAVTALYPMAILSGILKEQLKLILRSQYVTAARAAGSAEWAIHFKYALKNALLPILAALSNILPSLLTGAFIVEIIFSLPGIGSLLLDSILTRDLPMLEGAIILNGIFFVVVNYLFELLYPIVDPRIQVSDNVSV